MILETKSLSKSFGRKPALKNVSFSVGQQEIVGLIGPNGSGKTTLLNILLGLLKPTSGQFEVPPGVKIGMAVSRQGFFDDMTVKKNILINAQLLNVPNDRVYQLANDFNIDFENMLFGKLSAGMKQRVILSFAFMNNYDLILLDEPTNHLDVDSIVNLRSLVVEYKQRGTSFIITSHVLSDLEKVCDRILFLNNGSIIRDSTLDRLIHEFGTLWRRPI